MPPFAIASSAPSFVRARRASRLSVQGISAGARHEPSSGRLSLDGEVVYDDGWLRTDLRRLSLDKIGFTFEYPNLLPPLNGTDSVAVVLGLAG